MVCCGLDIFPVELLHHLLSYFSVYEIFYTLNNISDYIDDVLFTYSSYYVNFRSIKRKQFDFTCQHIRPDKVISLTLCDDETTPGQIELFLSRFQINQFTGLRSLTLVDIGPDFWTPIVTKLHDLKYLRSFIYITSNKIDTWIANIPHEEATRLDAYLFDCYSSILTQLKRLTLCHGDFFKSIQFPYLYHLFIDRCTVLLMKHLSYAAPQLKSLKTNFRNDETNVTFIFPFGQLKRLDLKIEGQPVSIEHMEQLLTNIPALEYLELHLNGEMNIVDGERWQMLTNRLIIFNFYFCISNSLNTEDLDSFRSPFWLDDKHWYVACLHQSIFSVPYFAETRTDGDFEPIPFSTLPDSTILNDCITQLTLSEPIVTLNERFNRVETLTMFHCIPLSCVERLVDLNRLHHLVLCSMTHYHGIQFLIEQMPNLCRISIRSKIKYVLEEFPCKRFPKIRDLDIGNRYSIVDDHDKDYSIDTLCFLFPHIEHLHIDHFCSAIQIFPIMNRLQNLTTVSFHFVNWFINDEDRNKIITEVKSILNEHRNTNRFEFTYRFDQSCVHIWL